MKKSTVANEGNGFPRFAVAGESGTKSLRHRNAHPHVVDRIDHFKWRKGSQSETTDVATEHELAVFPGHGQFEQIEGCTVRTS